MKLHLLQFIVVVGAIFLDEVTGHGYMKSPRSRNYVASADGVWWGGDEDTPEKESCPHCLNLGGSIARCGFTGDRNYDAPRNYFGESLGWSTQATYVPGATIDIETLLTTHHKGHIEVKACPVAPDEIATQDCFDSNPLEFISDELYGAPKHDEYPGRAYLAPAAMAEMDAGSGLSGWKYHYKFKLPDTISSGYVLLQWYYITGNSCTAPGYDTYPFPNDSWQNVGVDTCTNIPEDGIGVPEQFWNCAEIVVEGDGNPTSPPPTKSPTKAPTKDATEAPTKAPFVSSPSTDEPTESVTTSPTKPPSDPSDKTIIGYYASWQQYDRDGLAKPENMDFTKVDRVNFAFFQTNVDGFIYGTDSWGDPLVLFGPTNWQGTEHCSWNAPGVKSCAKHDHSKGLVSMVHAAGGEIYPSIGGWSLSNAFPPMASSQNSRARFAAQCAELIEAYDFDGIDIDWEYPGYASHGGTSSDKQNFNLLLDEVRSALDTLTARTGKYYGITAALPCGPSHINNIDIPHVADVLDELLLMTYDFHGAWDSITGVNAPLHYQGFGDLQFNADTCVNTWKAGGAPTSKLGLGLAFYGRSFSNASGLNEPHSGQDDINWAADDGLPQYFSIMEKMQSMTSVRHDTSKTQFAYFNNGSGFISYDDERSTCEKTEYAIDNGLKSFLIWELSGDLMPDLSTPLLDTVNSKLANPAMNCAGSEDTSAPTPVHTQSPTRMSHYPTLSPRTDSPTNGSLPTSSPTRRPTKAPVLTSSPTIQPTKAPVLTSSPTRLPTKAPSPAAPESCPSGFSGLIAVQQCSHYQHCASGILTGAPLACGPGTTFDENIQNCNFSYSVWCNGEPPAGVPLCPTGYSGWMGVDECTGYRYCTSGVVSTPHYDCPSGYLFDDSISACNHAQLVTCQISGTHAPTAGPAPTDPPTRLPTKADQCPSGQAMMKLTVMADGKSKKENVFIVKKRNASKKFKISAWKENKFPNNLETVYEKCMDTSECYKTIMKDKGKNGMCCDNGKGGYVVTFNGVTIMDTLTDFSFDGKFSRSGIFGQC